MFLLTQIIFASTGWVFTLGSLLSLSNPNVWARYSGSDERTLQQVTVVMRHGQRAPQDTYPKDPHIKNPMDPYGWGQLTNVGRVNQYNQGRFLRDRYDKFLGPIYSPDIFYLQCTDVDRTKMSAMLEAAALWKPVKGQEFLPHLPWQPVSLFYQKRAEDTLMLIWQSCPKYAKLRKEIIYLPEMQKVQSRNKQLYDELTNLTGLLINTPEDVSSLYGTLNAEKDMNLSVPAWTAEYYPEKLVPLTVLDLELNVYNNILKRLKGGPFLKKMINDMVAKKEGTLIPDRRKMFMYVGHDSTIVTFLHAMGIWNKQIPDYDTMIIIELHEVRNVWNVQIFLRNSTVFDPYPMAIPGCETICPLKQFIQILRPVIPINWQEECKVDNGYKVPPAPTA